MAAIRRSARYTRAAGALKAGIVLTLLGVFTLIVGLVSEPADPQLSAFDVLLILPAIFKLVLAELPRVMMTGIGAVVLIFDAALIVYGAYGVYRYRNDPAQVIPQTEAEMQRALDELDRQLASGEITKEEYSRKQRQIIWPK